MEDHKKHSLGHRAFILFLSRRIKLFLLLAIIDGAIWYGERWLPSSFLLWGSYAVNILLMISGAYFLFILAQTYLEYRYYTYMFTEEAFMMTSGLFVRNEVAALYHQIQNVNIERGPLDRIAGVSQIVIFMAGSERAAGHNKFVLPAVGKTKAKLVQKELLLRARRHFGAVPAASGAFIAPSRESKQERI